MGDLFEGLPEVRPPGLRRRSIPTGAVWWRIDRDHPDSWSWSPFPTPRNRFDPASAQFRTRYAAATVNGAARERYLASGRYIPADHRHSHLVRLEAAGRLRVLDLRTEANLDALGVDDRISTGREPIVMDTCHLLCDSVRRWWHDLDGILYRPRTTPASSLNLAFFGADRFRVSSRLLAECGAELDDLILRHQFTVGFDYLPAEPA